MSMCAALSPAGLRRISTGSPRCPSTHAVPASPRAATAGLSASFESGLDPQASTANPAVACLTPARVAALLAADPPAPATPTTSAEPAPAGAARRRRALARPAAYSSGEFSASATYASDDGDDEEAAASPSYRGLPPLALEQAFRVQHPGLLEALSSAGQGLTPSTAARLLRRLEAELPPALHERAPGGDGVLVALGCLRPLLDRAAGCAEAALARGRVGAAAAAARAALSLLSCLAFSSGASAAPYAAVAVRCKQALKVAYDAGAELRQEDAVELYCTCARASPWIWLTPYAGHAAAAAVDDFIEAGWASGELAVRFAGAYASLVGAGRLAQCERRWVRLAQAALRHPLSLEQAERLLEAAAQNLPVEMRIQLSLHARSEPAADWHSQLLAIKRLRERQAALSARRCSLAGGAAAPAALRGRRELAPARAARAAQRTL